MNSFILYTLWQFYSYLSQYKFLFPVHIHRFCSSIYSINIAFLMFHFKKSFIYTLIFLSINNVSLFANPLKFQNTDAHLVKVLFKISQLFDSSSVVCVISENQYVTGILLNILERNRIPLVLTSHFSINKLRVCNSIVVLEMENLTISSKLFSGSLEPSFYFLNYYSNVGFPQLEQSFFNSTSPEVVVFSNDSIFELSYIFPFPRRFILSSVVEVLEHRRDHRLNLGGTEVAVAFMTFPPFSIFPNLSAPGTGDGIEFVLINELSQQLNFTIQYKVYKYLGMLSSNGTWYGEGVVHAVQAGEADLAVANLFQIPSLYKAMYFGPSLNRNSFSFLVTRPEQIDYEWFVFTTIFKPVVWIFTSITFTVMVIVYHFGVSLNLRPEYQSWSASMLLIFGYFTMATSDGPHSSASIRTLLTAWSLFSLLLTTTLSTGIVSRLTLPLYTPRVDTIQQLVEGGFYWTNNHYRLYRNVTNEIRNVGLDFNDPWTRKWEKRYIFMEKEQVENVMNKDKKITFPIQTYGKGFFLVNNRGVANLNKIQTFRKTKQETRGCHVSWGVRKNSPLLRPLTIMTQRFIQAGLTYAWREQVLGRWPSYSVSQILIEQDLPTFGEPQPLKLAKVQPVLYLLVFGLAIASFVFLLEVNW